MFLKETTAFLVFAWCTLSSAQLCSQYTQCELCIATKTCVFVKLAKQTFSCVEKVNMIAHFPIAVYKSKLRCAKIKKLKHQTSSQSYKENVKQPRWATTTPHPISHVIGFNNLSKLASTPPSQTTSFTTPVPLKKAPTTPGSTMGSENMQSTTLSVFNEPSVEKVTQPETSTKPTSTSGFSTILPKEYPQVTSSSETTTFRFENATLPTQKFEESANSAPKTKRPIWMSPTKNYDVIKQDILETSCKLESLFRKFGELRFLEIESIPEFLWIRFQIANPVGIRFKKFCSK